MSKHTPGPWRMRARSATTLNLGIYNSTGALIASVDVHQMSQREVRECKDATARLIAAAPDMLAALQMLADPGRMEDSEWWGEALRARDAAIAKATGEAA